MAVNKRLLQGAAGAGEFVPSEHFGVVLYEGDGASGHSINGGKFGAGAYFDGGSSDKILIGNNLKNIFFDEFSISTWFYITETGNFQALVGNTDSARDRGILLFLRGDNNKLVWNASETGAPGPYFDVTSTVAFSANTWYHVVVTFNNSTDSDGAKLYINGSLDNSGQARTADIESSNDVHIGNSGLALDWPFHGKIDQTRFFTKVLSSSEVSTLYAETAETVESLDPLSEDTTDTLQVLGDSSCVATYRFENDEVDLSGNYDLTGNAIQYAAGRYGQAASFNGSSSYAEITSSPPQDSSGVMSVSFWAKTSSTSRVCFFIAEAPNPNKEFLKLENFGYQGTNSFRVSYDNNMLSNIDNVAISDGQWHHIVITAGNGNVKTYKDNSLLATQSVTITDRTLDNFVIGYRKYNNDLYFNGEIDQFRIFNKELSASEVTTLYQENSLVASYRFEGNANDDTRNYNGTATNVTYEYGLGFTPDFVWIKNRTSVRDHMLFDSTRGTTNPPGLYPNLTNAEFSGDANNFVSFDTGGFTVGQDPYTNENGSDMVAWAFKANGGTTSSNTDGSITSTVQVNETAGFSIIKYFGNFTTGATVGHGLGVVPELIIIKNLDSGTYNWLVYHKDLGNTQFLNLNTTGAATSLSDFNSTSPTSSVITLRRSALSNELYNYIGYCFASVEGFSKFGSYTGNGSDNGPIVETGFEPAFIMFKRSSSTGNWLIYDNKRSTTNTRNKLLFANDSAAEQTLAYVDFLSNGFQIAAAGGTGDTNINVNGSTYIYMAFAADPDTEAPTVAKSFSTVTYTGTGSSQAITGLGFAPNLVWVKQRGGTTWHNIQDTINGATKHLYTNATNALDTTSNGLTSFDSDGFTLGGGNGFNGSSQSMVAWAWKADDNEPTALYNSSAIAAYKFEDNANDVGGSYNGSATSITYNSSGKFNKSAEFNGSNSQITTNLAQSDTAAFTWSAWIKVHDFQGSSNVNILGTMNPSSPFNGVAIFIDLISISLGEGGSNIGNILSSPSTNTWYHIVVAYDGSTFKCYADGVNTLTVTNSNTDGGNFWMGKGGPTSWNNFDGELDQVRVYSEVLSATNISDLYNETTSDNDTLAFPTGIPNGAFSSFVSANANAGFSIVKWNGVGGTSKIQHGLSAAPELIINKQLSGSNSWDFWVTGATAIGWDKFLGLNRSDAEADGFNNTPFGDTAPTSTVFTVNSDSGAGIGGSGDEFISYCFHSVSGYSKIGSYSGGSTGSGNVITTGFQPDWIMIKRTDTADDWTIIDSVRGDGASSKRLIANTDEAEKAATSIWFPTSTGFYFSGTGASYNSSGGTYIYMAFKIN